MGFHKTSLNYSFFLQETLIESMTMTKEEREEFKKILRDCQDINGDNAFDILINFICDNLNDPNRYEFSKEKQKRENTKDEAYGIFRNF